MPGDVRFDDHHVDDATFTLLIGSPFNWLLVGAKLLRASRAVLKRLEDDASRIFANRYAAGVGPPAVMLAAMGCENALKALCVARRPIPVVSKLPKWLQGHDLEALAAKAQYRAASAAERDAIRDGEHFITWAGRYPATKDADQQPGRHGYRTPGLSATYAAIYLSCAEAVCSETWDPVDDGGPDAATYAATARAKYVTLIEV